MWNTIANFKENLNQIALEVQDAAEELEIYRSSSGEDSASSDRRNSHKFAQSKPPIGSDMDSRFKSEIGNYKAEIQRLQASEAEIKALSVNYAALLKEKEEQLSKLYQENGSLRQNLEATSAALRASANGHKGSVSKQGVYSNGSLKAYHSDGVQTKMEQRREKELADILEENRSLKAIRSQCESEIENLRKELNKERGTLTSVQVQLQDEHKINGDLQKEVNILKTEKDRGQNSTDMIALQNELIEKTSQVRRLQSELTRRDNEEQADESAGSLKLVIATLEKENFNLKTEKSELEVALKMAEKSLSHKRGDDSNPSDKQSSNLHEVHSSGNFHGKEEMELSLQKLEEDLQKACQERDKAFHDLARLKQHLLEKELEESDKMDEDSKIIEELQADSKLQRAQILQLEKALEKALASREEIKKMNESELQKLKEIIDDLKNRLTSCMSTIDAKNVELLNLQTALGQFYAESEAKERLERDYVRAREESAHLGQLLKESNQQAEVLKQEKGEMLDKLSQAESKLSEGKYRTHRLEEENVKLRRALEQNMTRLNRMSMDSDYYVDRRIVIKLLVTYIQKNHNKEVLDLMVRMLGFSEEDKQRIGAAQQGTGKGVVRGVLGLPGRLVGGILGGNSPEAHAHVPSENQSFADMWVDFLLKETEERERREAEESARGNKG